MYKVCIIYNGYGLKIRCIVLRIILRGFQNAKDAKCCAGISLKIEEQLHYNSITL